MDKIFVVGCPRSGTTLLQSLLASHTDIVSFPETHLFSRTISINPLLQFFSLYGNGKMQQVKEIVEELGAEVTRNSLDYTISSTKTWVQILLNNLDRIGEAHSSEQERYLLEKTPRHLHYVDLIQQTDPTVKFIHIIRNGEDVVASMVEATSENPDEWDGSRSVDESVFWWNRSIRLSEKLIGNTNNIHIRYENLVSDTEEVLRYLCSKLDLPFEQTMISRHHKTAEDMISDGENWKSKNTSAQINTSDKFSRFPEDTQQKIKEGLTDFDFSRIDIANLN